MRIGIDCRFWNQTGVGRYTRNLVSNLAKLDKANDYILFARTEDVGDIKLKTKNLRFKIVNADIPWHGIIEQVRFPYLINSQNLDLMHFPYFSVPVLYRKPFIVTVHDLIINAHKTGRASTLPYPLYLAKRVGYNFVVSRAIRNAKKIITPSNAVSTEIISNYKNVLGKIEVTYEGGFENSSKVKVESSKLIEGRYLLRVGNFYPHKNIEKLIEAFRDFLFDSYENHDIKLVMVGKRDYFYRRIEAMVDDMMLSENISFIENPNDDLLVSLYQNAIATIIPSLAEGFSLTGVEALSCGSPVIASDIPVHREIFEKVALYCNPADSHDIKRKLDFIINLDENSREEFVEQGKKQAAKYSWQKMAEETLQIYNSVAS